MIPPAPDNTTTLVLRRTFAASRQRVFRAWIEPAALQRWLHLRGMRVTVSLLEAQVGGSFRFEVANGDFIVGTYLDIIPPEKLVFTWAGQITQGQGSIVTLNFLDQGAATEVVLTHEGLSTPELKLARVGWTPLLDALAEMLRLPADN